MEIDMLLEELFTLLDKHEDIKRLDELKQKISPDLLTLIEDYRTNPSIINKKKLYDHELFREYMQCESNINYLIMNINKKFKRGKVCENHQW